MFHYNCLKVQYVASFHGYNIIIIIIIIITTTLFESQIILAEHECCTNWGDCKSNESNQIKSNIYHLSSPNFSSETSAALLRERTP